MYNNNSVIAYTIGFIVWTPGAAVAAAVAYSN